MVLTPRSATVIAMILSAQLVGAQDGGGRRGRQGGGVGGGEEGNSLKTTTMATNRRPVLYGFALECYDCQPSSTGRGRVGGGGGRGGPGTVWTYSSYPRVAAVLPGSAAEEAGIHAGDLLVSIDGLSLLAEEGSRRFSSAASGEEVRLTFERDSKRIDVPLTLGRGRVGGPQQIMLGEMSARYTGAYGNVDLDVWSDEPVNVSRDSTGAMILRTGTTVVRLRADGVSSGGRGRGMGGASGGAGTGRGRGRGGPPSQ